MGDTRAPFELTLKFGVHSDTYDEARAIGRKLAERFDDADVIALTDAGAHSRKLELVDLRVERRGAMRP